jgi:TPR repeat protein
MRPPRYPMSAHPCKPRSLYSGSLCAGLILVTLLLGPLAHGSQEKKIIASSELCSLPPSGTPVKNPVPDDSRFLDQQYALLGPNHDYTKEFASLKEQATKGNADAQFNLGIAYVRGIGTAKDPTEGMRWLRAATDQGQPRASHYLSSMYIAGDGVPLEYATAYYWLLISGAAGHENYNEDVLKAILSPAQAQDAEHRAADWLRAHSSVPNYAYELAVEYKAGTRVEKDQQNYLKWLRQAAQGGHSYAQFRLGLVYLIGDGVQKDRDESLKWLRLAALQGEPRAQLFLGKACVGKDPPGNPAAGKAWLELALKSKDAYVFDSMANYYTSDPDARNLDLAVRLAERAVEQTNDKDADYLGTLAAAYYANGQTEDAIKAARQCVLLKPKDAHLLNQLAWWELTAKEEQFRDPVEALQLAKVAVAVSEEKEPALLDTLAEAYYANGDPQKAVELERKAIALNPSDLETYRSNLDKYANAQQQKK